METKHTLVEVSIPLTFQIEEDEKEFLAVCLQLKGCIVSGETPEIALKNCEVAASLYFKSIIYEWMSLSMNKWPAKVRGTALP